jgi:hypothetical protein
MADDNSTPDFLKIASVIVLVTQHMDFRTYYTMKVPTDFRLAPFLVGKARSIKPAYNGATKDRNFWVAGRFLLYRYMKFRFSKL